MIRTSMALCGIVLASHIAACCGQENQPKGSDTLPPHMAKKLGDLLDRDWQERPEWADMFVAILRGRAMDTSSGWWKPASKRFDWDWLRERMDHNQDGTISRDELPQSEWRDLFLRRLDRNGDSQVRADDLDWTPGNALEQHAGEAASLFYRMDKDSNGKVTQNEIAAFFQAADPDRAGFLNREDFATLLNPPPNNQNSNEGMPSVTQLTSMLLTGQLGVLDPGPALNDQAPDFTLQSHDGKRIVTLSESRGNKPVVLIFGSFT